MSNNRRCLLQAALGTGVSMLLPPCVLAQSNDPRNVRPQEGDRLVYADGDDKGKPVKAAALTPGTLVTALPQDAASGTVRDGSRLNQILLVRLDPVRLLGETPERAAQGVVAYSAVCTHSGCDSFEWMPAKQSLKCPSHDSEFDPADGAKVIGGPAPRRLPALPIKIVDGQLVVAAAFTGRVGATSN